MPLRACDLTVFRYKYKTTIAERISTYGGMDSELTGNYTTHVAEYIIVAPSKELAQVMYERRHKNDEFISIETIGHCSDLVFIQ